MLQSNDIRHDSKKSQQCAVTHLSCRAKRGSRSKFARERGNDVGIRANRRANNAPRAI